MKAAVYTDEKRLVIKEVPDPVADDDEIIMKVKYCAICGSDIHRYIYGMIKPGTILGHEFSGIVADIGKNVTGFKIGDRVARWGGKILPGRDLPNFPPRYSAKERGFLPQPPGAYAHYMAIDANKVVKLPDEVSDIDAALLEPLTVAVHAVRLSKISLGDKVVVIAAGPIGLFTIQCAKLAGAINIFVSEINEKRLQVASTIGANYLMNPMHDDVVKKVVDSTSIGADIIFECAGAKNTLQQSLEMAKMGGQVVVVSLCWEQADCLPVEWVGREVEMKASYGHLNSEWEISLNLMRMGKISTKPMITKIIELSEIDDAFRDLLEPKSQSVQLVVKT
jgi:(R,R)-butanediol dehydrogenase/meso-butanediol dehydrogenase/diacetyl reductase